MGCDLHPVGTPPPTAAGKIAIKASHRWRIPSFKDEKKGDRQREREREREGGGEAKRGEEKEAKEEKEQVKRRTRFTRTI